MLQYWSMFSAEAEDREGKVSPEEAEARRRKLREAIDRAGRRLSSREMDEVLGPEGGNPHRQHPVGYGGD